MEEDGSEITAPPSISDYGFSMCPVGQYPDVMEEKEGGKKPTQRDMLENTPSSRKKHARIMKNKRLNWGTKKPHAEEGWGTRPVVREKLGFLRPPARPPCFPPMIRFGRCVVCAEE